jgi:hypothetical protein
MKNIFLSSIFISMISCHINGSFHRSSLKNIVILCALRNYSTSSSSLTKKDFDCLVTLLKQLDLEVINGIANINNEMKKLKTALHDQQKSKLLDNKKFALSSVKKSNFLKNKHAIKITSPSLQQR